MGVYPHREYPCEEYNQQLLTLDLAGMPINDYTVGQEITDQLNTNWETLAILCLETLFEEDREEENYNDIDDDDSEQWTGGDIMCTENSIPEDSDTIDTHSEDTSTYAIEPPRKRIKICVRDGKTSWTYSEDAY